MSIRRIQIERILEDITHALYALGVKPEDEEIFSAVSDYFSQFPAGVAFPVSDIAFTTASGVSDVDSANLAMGNTLLNLDLLYTASQEQVEEVMQVTSMLQDQLSRLRSRRRVVSTQIDDYLLSLYNTDGYYYSVGDSFNDTSYTDLDLTSAFIDTNIGACTLPVVSGLTKKTPGSLIKLNTVRAVVNPKTTNAPANSPAVGPFVANETYVPYKVISPFSGAVDGLTNTVWSIEVETASPSEVVCEIMIRLGDANNVVELSRVEIDPNTITNVQMYVDVHCSMGGGEYYWKNFSGNIFTDNRKMAFIDTRCRADQLRIVMRKTKHDYVQGTGTSTKYKYLFGAKEINITQAVYDREAILVSDSLSISPQLVGDMVIDAVSLAVEAETPSGTDITYYVANDPGDAEDIGSFEWHQIEPVGEFLENRGTVVRFDGAQQFTRNIVDVPTLSDDIQRIALDNSNADLAQRNPSQVIVPGIDVYRIAEFEETFLQNSIILEEGVSRTRIYHTALEEDADNFAWWQEKINSGIPPEVAYGKIDAGNGFFYGGDVGSSGRSIFVETYLEMLEDREPYISELHKSDFNSAIWSVRAFLNGREVGFLDIGVEKLLIPWTFKRGLNHIALLIQIPQSTVDIPSPYIGVIELLGGAQLAQFGTAKLSTWTYVSTFDMRYNQTGQPYTFIVENGEIVSRRQPSTDFRLRYAQANENGPSGIRVRADMNRNNDNPDLSPKLNLYRLRFQYG